MASNSYRVMQSWCVQSSVMPRIIWLTFSGHEPLDATKPDNNTWLNLFRFLSNSTIRLHLPCIQKHTYSIGFSCCKSLYITFCRLRPQSMTFSSCIKL